MAAFDFKKSDKQFYFPTTTPSLIDVPEMLFIMVDGEGDPNTSTDYAHAVEVLYGLSYTIKMSKMGESQPDGYFDFVVPPLEGLWGLPLDAFEGSRIINKDAFTWTSLIRVPSFVTPLVFEEMKTRLAVKKPQLDLSVARLEAFTEGLCAQVMHIGPYDAEPATVDKLDAFIEESGYRSDMAGNRRHHEIYLGDPRKTAPEKLKTVIRHPITA